MPVLQDGKRGRGRPATGRMKTAQVTARFDATLRLAMQQFRLALEFPPTETAVLEVALREYLERKGYWPVRP